MINEKKFLRLQNIKSLFIAVTFIIIGASGLWWSSKNYIIKIAGVSRPPAIFT